MPWAKILGVLFVLALLGSLLYLGSRIPPNDSGSDG
jgi:hypothetical protein